MENQSTHPPLNLAAAAATPTSNDITAFAIDPSLEASSEFFPSTGTDQGSGNEDDGRPTQEDIDAVIKASLDHAQAEAEAEAHAHAHAHAHAANVTNTDADTQAALLAAAAITNFDNVSAPSITPGIDEQHEGDTSLQSTPKVQVKPKRPKTDNLRHGQENNPINNPSLHIAPFSKPIRDESTPLPLYLLFDSKANFIRWLDAESSWCHFVQRRTTTPDKRSAERLQARIRAHNRSLEAMNPEERSTAAPLKTRQRKRVSPVLEKVTFTCHHAGTYESKHSTVLPKEKLRLNTKRSVKCACASRIVLSENQSGDCRVVYHWKHDGHDPFSDADTEGGRLPKAIDIWLNKQIEAGKTLDDIRKVLNISEEEKEAYLAKVAADPTTMDPSLPPPLALALKVKYPDIYNRYRKLKGPVKEHKQLKGSTKRTSSGTMKNGSKINSSSQSHSPLSLTQMSRNNGTEMDMGIEDHKFNSSDQAGNENGIDHDQNPLGNILDPLLTSYDQDEQNKLDLIQPTQAQLHEHSLQHGHDHDHEHDLEHQEVDNEFAQLASSHDLTSTTSVDELSSTHEGLARALLELPSGGGLRDEDGNEMSLEEAMRRMAEGVAAVAASQEVDQMGI
ncbi:uncharacterized protein IL334_007326 [Kwoniella shivajii]|uniref:HMG box domain-containing protein n=1 Tax=Kwoniella shivajii TaxID=564305 RepID=A0ABZ1D8C7_9TREE|nr:hypothetical protein IL334_007326 [Kwoniella shivajii]